MRGVTWTGTNAVSLLATGRTAFAEVSKFRRIPLIHLAPGTALWRASEMTKTDMSAIGRSLGQTIPLGLCRGGSEPLNFLDSPRRYGLFPRSEPR